MHLEARVEPSLPPLAWCTRVRRGEDRVELICGGGVELGDAAFFEGAWDGNFTAMDFTGAAAVFGSGARVHNNAITFVTPSHTCERLQWLRSADGQSRLISNSLCFLLAMGGEELDRESARYAHLFADIVHGIEHSPQRVRLAGGGELTLVYFRNFRVNRDLRVEYAQKSDAYSFATFGEYQRALEQTTQSVIANASDPARSASRYRALASVSSGYDSPACAVLAKRAGATRALTLTRARGADNTSDETDSGKPVGDALGLETREFSRLDYQSSSAAPEAEFLATGMSGEDVNLLPFEGELGGSVFFTGFHGDKIWDKHIPPNSVLKRGDLSGASLSEFRLRVNFIHLPVPFIGGLHHPQLRALSNSSEMQPWSIGGEYDRPIPRRIAEEAGVPRHLFGQTKKATTSLLHVFGVDAMSPGARAGIKQFIADHGLSKLAQMRFRLDELEHRACSMAARILRKFRLLHFFPPLAHRTFNIHSHTALGPLPMCWAIESIIAERYQSICAKRSKNPDPAP
jgi:hypothetical protein